MALLLSNNPKFLTGLDESTQSSLQPEIIHFKNYNTIDLEEILLDRSKGGIETLPDRGYPPDSRPDR